MATKLTTIQRFLGEQAHPELAARWHKGMETQVLTARDDGVPFFEMYKEKRWRGYHKAGLPCTPEANSQGHERKRGCQFWKDYRIPWNAMSDAQYTDSEQSWDLAEHALGIGSTGWNWQARTSEWFGFDFDSIANHEGYGRALTDSELASVLASVQGIPWVEVRRSKSGKGFHLYVFLDEPMPTDNHSEHAAVARAVLDRMSALAGAQLNASVDCVGGNVWLWHRDSGPDGWQRIKAATETMPISLIPEDWKRHLAVTRNRKLKTSGKGLEDILKRRRQVPLDDDHRRLLAWLAERTSEIDWEWSQDQWMLRTHTAALKRAHNDLALRGLFYTDSQGHDLLTGNCFLFPEIGGSWEVRRFGEGCDEHPSWSSDGTWTRCMFNSPATLDDASRAHGGNRDAEGAFHFEQLAEARLALHELGYDTPGLDAFDRRMARVFTKKGHLVCRFRVDGDEKNPASGWIKITKGGKWWERTFQFREDSKPVELPDEVVRAVAGGGTHAGYWVYARGQWVAHPSGNAQNVLMALHGVDQATSKTMLGAAVLNHWREVNEPFAPEYPGDRCWNRRGARLAIQPEEGAHPHWDLILSHLGRGLDEAVGHNPWCQKHMVHSGQEYLRLWVASLFQSPKSRLPYLFFFGDQNTGKSLLHESLSMFFERARGYVLANQALTSKSRFNGELAGALLCAVEEINLRVEREAYNRMKDWVTGTRISIRALHKDARDEENCTHWIHCANFAEYCPVEWGDTRVVMIHVVAFEGEEIAKEDMLERLRLEAPGFLHSILAQDIPPAPGRLRVPTIATAAKDQQVQANMTPLQEFLQTETTRKEGRVLLWSEFFERFALWLKPHQRQYWTPASTSRKFPADYPKGKWGGKGAMHIGNIQWADGEHNGGRGRALQRNSATGRLTEV